MKFLSSPWLKATAAFTTFAYFATSISWASPAPKIEAPRLLSSEISQPLSLAEKIEIPESLGTISSRHFSTEAGRGTLLHIQDAHSSNEAQSHIRQILSHLKTQYGVNTIFLEGGLGEIRPEPLLYFREEKDNKKLADIFAREALIGGPELFLVDQYYKQPSFSESAKGVRPRRHFAAKAYGIEDRALYEKNIKQYRKVLSQKKTSEKFIREFQSQIFTQSSRVFNKDLQTFFREWSKIAVAPDQILRNLSGFEAQAEKTLGLNFRNPEAQIEWPQWVRVIRLRDLEMKINRAAAESERKAVEEWIKSLGSKIHAEEFVSLLNSAPNAGNPREIIEKFYDEASPQGFHFEKYPEFSKTLGRQILQKELDSAALFQEIQKLTQKIFQALAKSEEEKKLIAAYQDSLLLQKLFSLELVRNEYEQVKSWGPGFVDRVALFVEPRTPKPETQKLSAFFHTAIAFYDTAIAREKSMLDRTIQTLQQENSITKRGGAAEKFDGPIAVIVTGGFHSEGLAEAAQKLNLSFVEITPKITDLNEKNNYEKVMMSPRSQRAAVNSLVQQGHLGDLKLPELSFGSEFRSEARSLAQALAREMNAEVTEPSTQIGDSPQVPGLAPWGQTPSLKQARRRAEARMSNQEIQEFIHAFNQLDLNREEDIQVLRVFQSMLETMPNSEHLWEVPILSNSLLSKRKSISATEFSLAIPETAKDEMIYKKLSKLFAYSDNDSAEVLNPAWIEYLAKEVLGEPSPFLILQKGQLKTSAEHLQSVYDEIARIGVLISHPSKKKGEWAYNELKALAWQGFGRELREELEMLDSTSPKIQKRIQRAFDILENIEIRSGRKKFQGDISQFLRSAMAALDQAFKSASQENDILAAREIASVRSHLQLEILPSGKIALLEVSELRKELLEIVSDGASPEVKKNIREAANNLRQFIEYSRAEARRRPDRIQRLIHAFNRLDLTKEEDVQVLRLFQIQMEEMSTRPEILEKLPPVQILKQSLWPKFLSLSPEKFTDSVSESTPDREIYDKLKALFAYSDQDSAHPLNPHWLKFLGKKLLSSSYEDPRLILEKERLKVSENYSTEVDDEIEEIMILISQSKKRFRQDAIERIVTLAWEGFGGRVRQQLETLQLESKPDHVRIKNSIRQAMKILEEIDIRSGRKKFSGDLEDFLQLAILALDEARQMLLESNHPEEAGVLASSEFLLSHKSIDFIEIRALKKKVRELQQNGIPLEAKKNLKEAIRYLNQYLDYSSRSEVRMNHGETLSLGLGILLGMISSSLIIPNALERMHQKVPFLDPVEYLTMGLILSIPFFLVAALLTYAFYWLIHPKDTSEGTTSLPTFREVVPSVGDEKKQMPKPHMRSEIRKEPMRILVAEAGKIDEIKALEKRYPGQVELTFLDKETVKDPAALQKKIRDVQPHVITVRSGVNLKNSEALQMLSELKGDFPPVILRSGAEIDIRKEEASQLQIAAIRTNGSEDSVAETDQAFYYNFLNQIFPDSFEINPSEEPEESDKILWPQPFKYFPEVFKTAIARSEEAGRGIILPEQRELLFPNLKIKDKSKIRDFHSNRIWGLAGFGVIPEVRIKKMNRFNQDMGANPPTLAWSRSLDANEKSALEKATRLGVISATKRQILTRANMISIYLPTDAGPFIESKDWDIIASRAGPENPIAIMNLSRFASVDHEALLEKMRQMRDEKKSIYFYYFSDIDLTDKSKKPIEVLEKLRTEFPKNVLMTNHIAAFTDPALEEVERRTVQNLEKLIQVYQTDNPFEDLDLAKQQFDFIVSPGPRSPRAEVRASSKQAKEVKEDPIGGFLQSLKRKKQPILILDPSSDFRRGHKIASLIEDLGKDYGITFENQIVIEKTFLLGEERLKNQSLGWLISFLPSAARTKGQIDERLRKERSFLSENSKFSFLQNEFSLNEDLLKREILKENGDNFQKKKEINLVHYSLRRQQESLKELLVFLKANPGFKTIRQMAEEWARLKEESNLRALIHQIDSKIKILEAAALLEEDEIEIRYVTSGSIMGRKKVKTFQLKNKLVKLSHSDWQKFLDDPKNYTKTNVQKTKHSQSESRAEARAASLSPLRAELRRTGNRSEVRTEIKFKNLAVDKILTPFIDKVLEGGFVDLLDNEIANQALLELREKNITPDEISQAVKTINQFDYLPDDGNRGKSRALLSIFSHKLEMLNQPFGEAKLKIEEENDIKPVAAYLGIYSWLDQVLYQKGLQGQRQEVIFDIDQIWMQVSGDKHYDKLDVFRAIEAELQPNFPSGEYAIKTEKLQMNKYRFSRIERAEAQGELLPEEEAKVEELKAKLKRFTDSFRQIYRRTLTDSNIEVGFLHGLREVEQVKWDMFIHLEDFTARKRDFETTLKLWTRFSNSEPNSLVKIKDYVLDLYLAPRIGEMITLGSKKKVFNQNFLNELKPLLEDFRQLTLELGEFADAWAANRSEARLRTLAGRSEIRPEPQARGEARTERSEIDKAVEKIAALYFDSEDNVRRDELINYLKKTIHPAQFGILLELFWQNLSTSKIFLLHLICGGISSLVVLFILPAFHWIPRVSLIIAGWGFLRLGMDAVLAYKKYYPGSGLRNIPVRIGNLKIIGLDMQKEKAVHASIALEKPFSRDPVFLHAILWLYLLETRKDISQALNKAFRTLRHSSLESVNSSFQSSIDIIPVILGFQSAFSKNSRKRTIASILEAKAHTFGGEVHDRNTPMLMELGDLGIRVGKNHSFSSDTRIIGAMLSGYVYGKALQLGSVSEAFSLVYHFIKIIREYPEETERQILRRFRKIVRSEARLRTLVGRSAIRPEPQARGEVRSASLSPLRAELRRTGSRSEVRTDSEQKISIQVVRLILKDDPAAIEVDKKLLEQKLTGAARELQYSGDIEVQETIIRDLSEIPARYEQSALDILIVPDQVKKDSRWFEIFKMLQLRKTSGPSPKLLWGGAWYLNTSMVKSLLRYKLAPLGLVKKAGLNGHTNLQETLNWIQTHLGFNSFKTRDLPIPFQKEIGHLTKRGFLDAVQKGKNPKEGNVYKLNARGAAYTKTQIRAELRRTEGRKLNLEEEIQGKEKEINGNGDVVSALQQSSQKEKGRQSLKRSNQLLYKQIQSWLSPFGDFFGQIHNATSNINMTLRDNTIFAFREKSGETQKVRMQAPNRISQNRNKVLDNLSRRYDSSIDGILNEAKSSVKIKNYNIYDFKLYLKNTQIGLQTFIQVYQVAEQTLPRVLAEEAAREALKQIEISENGKNQSWENKRLKFLQELEKMGYPTSAAAKPIHLVLPVHGDVDLELLVKLAVLLRQGSDIFDIALVGKTQKEADEIQKSLFTKIAERLNVSLEYFKKIHLYAVPDIKDLPKASRFNRAKKLEAGIASGQVEDLNPFTAMPIHRLSAEKLRKQYDVLLMLAAAYLRDAREVAKVGQILQLDAWMTQKNINLSLFDGQILNALKAIEQAA